MMHFARVISIAAGAALLTSLAGCGDDVETVETHEVSGVVKYNDNPVPNVIVTFIPEKGPQATGRTNEKGEFTLTTSQPDDGAVAGTHKVTIVPSTASDGDSNPTSADAYALPAAGKTEAPFPAKYSDQNTSDLTVKVPEDVADGSVELILKD